MVRIIRNIIIFAAFFLVSKAKATCYDFKADSTGTDTVSIAVSPVMPHSSHDESRDLSQIVDSLRKNYEFAKAIRFCDSVKVSVTDSSMLEKIEDEEILAQNGFNMLSYCSKPVVIAKQKFSLEEFYLFYPLENESWHPLPNVLDSLSDSDFPGAMYMPSNAETIFYSAKDKDGIRNLYRTDYRDSAWSVPHLINEQLMSSSDEIFPMLSADGSTLFFASKGLYGMGGYDLYSSKWNKEINDWDTPVNMGFPYSSPYDDFLFYNTPDGKYSIFASNRETSRDSVYIYVLEYDSMPVRKEISDRKELIDLSLLNPVDDLSRIDNKSAISDDFPQTVDTKAYSQKMNKIRALRDSISAFTRKADSYREGLYEASEDEKAGITSSILEIEMKVPVLQDSLKILTSELQQIEMKFLEGGFVIDPEKMQEEADREVVGVSSGYVFSKNSMGKPLNIKVERPEPVFDYTFRILPEGRYAEDNTIPEGLVYQIYLFTASGKVDESKLKGISPVFWKMSHSLRYTYYAGLFGKYNDVLSNLNKVKKAGFKNASIVALKDGKPISIAQAKELEKTAVQLYQIRIFPSDGDSLSETEITDIHSLTHKDLSKDTASEKVSYIVGPYSDRIEAEKMASRLKINGISNISVESAGELQNN